MKSEHTRKFESIDDIHKGFQDAEYICNRQIATTLYLARHLEKPILVEGPAGVGKTELAKAAAAYMDIPLRSGSSATRVSTNQRLYMNGNMESSYCTPRS